jgi:hypothetical protein
MGLISKGVKTKGDVVKEHIATMREIFLQVMGMVGHMDRAMSKYFEPLANMNIQDNANAQVTHNFSQCGKCGGMTVLVETDVTQKLPERIVRCEACKLHLPAPRKGQLQPTDHMCPLCNFQVL